MPSWSRNGKWIYFGSNRSGKEQIWRAPAEGGAPQQMTTAGGEAPFESWDGRMLYYSRPVEGGRALFEIPAAGGPERPLNVTTTFWNYAPGKRGLYYAGLRLGAKVPYTYELRLLEPAGTHRVLHTARLAHLAPGLSVHPDGQTLLFSGVAAIAQDLYRIENFR